MPPPRRLAACSAVSEGRAGAMDSVSGTIGGGVECDACRRRGLGPLERFMSGGRGGGTATAAVAGAASSASRRWRSSATWFMAFRAKIRATIAIAIGANKTKGSSNIWPPGGRVRALTGHVRSLVAILCAALSAKSSNQAARQCRGLRCKGYGIFIHILLELKGLIPDRAGTAGLRPSCCRAPFRPARAASGPRAPAPCRRD